MSTYLKTRLRTVFDPLQGQFLALTADNKRLPWSSLSASFADHLNIAAALPLKDRIDQQKESLIENSAHFLTIQYIWQNVCGQPANLPLYRAILGRAKEQQMLNPSQSYTQAVRACLFEEIDKCYPSSASGFNYLKKGVLKVRSFLVHVIATLIIKYFANKGITTYLERFHSYIKAHEQKDDFVSLRTELSQNLSRCLTVLSGAYTSIIRRPMPSHTISEMVAQELASPQANGGIDAKHLYKKMANNIIATTLGTIPGFFVSRLVGLFIAPEAIVDTLVKTTATSAVDNRGYSHSMNLLFLDQLKQLAELLKKPRKESKQEAEPLSEERKRELSVIIHYLMEILNKSECKTIDALSTLIKGKGFWPIVQMRHVENWGVSQIMEAMVMTIANLLQMVDEQKIDTLVYQVLKLSNQAFFPTETVPVQTMKKTENAVARTTKEILKLTIDTGIYEALKNRDPWLGAYYMPNPLTIGKKLLSTVRFIPSLFTPIPLGITALISSPFLSHTAAAHTLEFTERYQISTISLPAYLSQMTNITSIDLKELFHKDRIDAVQTFLQTHMTTTVLYVSAPLLLCYGIYAAAHARATQRVQQLFRLSTQPNTYLSGLHHLLFIPYLNARRF